MGQGRLEGDGPQAVAVGRVKNLTCQAGGGGLAVGLVFGGDRDQGRTPGPLRSLDLGDRDRGGGSRGAEVRYGVASVRGRGRAGLGHRGAGEQQRGGSGDGEDLAHHVVLL